MIYCNRCGNEYDGMAEHWACPVCRWKNENGEAPPPEETEGHEPH